MTITGTWKGDEAAKVSFELPAAGFYRLGPRLPDIFFDHDAERGTIVLANGDATGEGGYVLGETLSGTLRIFGAEPALAEPRHLTLYHGCAHVARMGTPAVYSPPREWTNFHIKTMPTDPDAVQHIMARLEAMDFHFNDTGYANPEQSKSSEGRVCQALWGGSLAAALAIDHDRVRQAAQDFTDFQLAYRHLLHYFADGTLLTPDSAPWWRAGSNGWDGQTKLTLSSSNPDVHPNPYAFEAVCQHLAPDRFFELAVGFNDFAAKLYTNAYINAVYSRPQVRDAKLAAQQREHGYLMHLGALVRVGGFETTERAESLQKMVAGWRNANGFAPITGEPYPSISPAKTGTWSHGYPSLYDWEVYSKGFGLSLEGVLWEGEPLLPPVAGGTCDHLIPWLEWSAEERGLSKDSFTFAKNGLWQGSTIIFMTAVAVGGLCDLRDVGAPISDINTMIQHAASCIVGPGQAADRIDNYGNTIQPNYVYDCYLSRNPIRAVQGPGKNSTTRWIPERLLRARTSCGVNLEAKCTALAERIWMDTDYPDADAPINLETMGTLPIDVFGIPT